MGDKRQDKHDAHCNVAYFPSSSYSWYSSVNRVEVTVVAMVVAVRGGAQASGYDGGWLSYRVREEGSLASDTGVPI